MENSKYGQFKAKMEEIALINSTIALLQWDQEVNMPPKGEQVRGEQMEYFSVMAHQKSVLPSLRDAMEAALEDPETNEQDKINITLAIKDFEKDLKLPQRHVAELSKATSLALGAWQNARQSNDFKIFEPNLERIVGLMRERTELLGYKADPYDALLDEYDEGLSVDILEPLFHQVKDFLIPLLAEVRLKSEPSTQVLQGNFPVDIQMELCRKIAAALGYDFDAGRLDLSAHPFSTSFSPLDSRITTRVNAASLEESVWSVIHEVGHALYEQGLPAEQFGLPLGEAVSLSIHESQSRFWENNIGRSLPFIQHWWPEFTNRFPSLNPFSSQQFFQAINSIKPNYIRIESDEATYHLHIILRYEIERELISGKLAVKDLPEAWNQRLNSYLGLSAPPVGRGVLQDIHWAHGSFGYFPTYSLGSFCAAQFAEKIAGDLTGVNQMVGEGNFRPILDWLRVNVHQHGRRYSTQKLMEKSTGQAMSIEPWKRYMAEKIKQVYG